MRYPGYRDQVVVCRGFFFRTGDEWALGGGGTGTPTGSGRPAVGWASEASGGGGGAGAGEGGGLGFEKTSAFELLERLRIDWHEPEAVAGAEGEEAGIEVGDDQGGAAEKVPASG